jgi:D-alanyl-D-alanine carboxypeptidase/D-alanyl-D-alanine-endopeptidase (penicillin-binding protein 4)
MRFIISLFLIHLCIYSSQAQSKSKPSLSEEINKLINKSLDSETDYSISFRNIEDDTLIYQKNPDQKLILASVSKIFTTAAALHHLGKDFKFKTLVYFENDTLYIKGQGDPFMVAENFRLFSAQVARKLKALGINEIKGNIVSVAGYFDGVERDSNRKSRSTTRPYNSSISELSLNFNSMSLEVHPSNKVGKKPKFFIVPVGVDSVIIENKAKTTGGSRNSLKIKRNGNSENYTLTGTIGVRSKPKIVYAATSNPKKHFLGSLKTLLIENGIKIEGDIDSESSAKPKSSSLILEYEGTPIDRAVKLLNRYSNNFMADQIFKTIGAEKSAPPGSFAKGKKEIENYLSSIGITSTQATINNGSGLTNANEATANAVTKLLSSIRNNFSNYPELLYSFTGGDVEGTGKTRLSNLNRRNIAPSSVRFKTGTLFKKHTVSTIAGYTSGKSGKLIAFAIIINKKNQSSSSLINKFRTLQDNIISKVLSY